MKYETLSFNICCLYDVHVRMTNWLLCEKFIKNMLFNIKKYLSVLPKNLTFVAVILNTIFLP